MVTIIIALIEAFQPRDSSFRPTELYVGTVIIDIIIFIMLGIVGSK